MSVARMKWTRRGTSRPQEGEEVSQYASGDWEIIRIWSKCWGLRFKGEPFLMENGNVKSGPLADMKRWVEAKESTDGI